jgi:hypothetical protein
MKTTGAIWNEYLNSWPEGQWHDFCDLMVNGETDVDPVPDDAVVELTVGFIYRNDRSETNLVNHFNDWLINNSKSVAVQDESPPDRPARMRP